MADYDEIRQEFGSTGAEFLLTDVAVGLTFMEVAATSRDANTVARNHRNAREAYNTVLGFLSRLALSDADRETVSIQLDVLRARLLAAGVEV